MSIASEITRLQTAKADVKTAIEAKGVTVPSNATLDTYDDYVAQISGGGDDKLKGVVDGSISAITASDLDGILTVKSSAFRECVSLKNAAIPNGVTKFGSYAFYDCTSLSAVTIPPTLTSIGTSEFQNCYKLESVTLPSGVTSTEYNSFASIGTETTNGADITLKGVKSIGNYSFSKAKINTLTFETPVTGHSNSWLYNTTANTLNIGGTIFTGTSSTSNWLYTTINVTDRTRFQVKNINILSGTTSIGNYAFYSGLSITSIDMSAATGITSIGNYALGYCTGMTSCVIPNSVSGTNLGSSAFYNCYSLQSINIPTGLTQIQYNCFYNCRSLTGITIPNSVTYIAGSAFAGCTGATVLNLSSVQNIESSAFYNCKSLTTVVVPATVTDIGTYCFSGCSNMQYFRFLSTTPPTLAGNGVFTGTNSCPIYVPSGSVDTYKTANVWSGWADRIQAWTGD